MKNLEGALLTQTCDARDVLTLPHHMSKSFPIRVVRGLVLPDSPTLVVPGINRERDVNEEPITLPDMKMRRLAEFISRIGGEPFYYNCATFAAHMHGEASLDDARVDMRVSVGSIREVAPDDLFPGDSYLIYLADQKTSVHSVVGTDDPTEHLAVWGDNGPLAVAKNSAMMDTYQAAHVMEVNGHFTLA